MVLKPSEIRTIILEEHCALRRRLLEIETGVNLVEAGTGSHGELHGALQRFYELFLLHITHEETILKPALREIDNWGPVRIELMDVEHAEQRLTIRALSQLTAEPDVKAYIARIRGFVEEVRLDMAAEERDFLSQDVLRDDSISIDAFGG